MIIIDQNKEGCFWFGPGNCVTIEEDGPDLGTWFIVARKVGEGRGGRYVLGEYATLEYAKDVLNDIAGDAAHDSKLFYMPKDRIVMEGK